MSAARARPEELAGLWRRSLLLRADGTSDTTTSVRWLQGERAFIDLRQPASRGAVRSAGCRDELSHEDCLRLAEQQGFAGQLRLSGSYFEWVRSIDFQPRTHQADAGSLTWQKNVLIENGRDVRYVEHWHRDADQARQPLWALELGEPSTAIRAALVRVGELFMFARDRNIAATPECTLHTCVAQAGSLAEARGLIDCEISFGEVRAGAFQITASTLPYRVGEQLALELTRSVATVSDRRPQGVLARRGFEILEIEGEPAR
jgi:hypothetical protein